MTHRLRVEVVSASNIMAADPNGLSDPYVKFYWRGKKYKTEVLKKTLNPVWNSTFLLEFEQGKDSSVLTLEVWDWDFLGTNDPLGQVKIALDQFHLTKPSDGVYPIQTLQGIAQGHMRVKLELLHYSTPSINSMYQQAIGQVIPQYQQMHHSHQQQQQQQQQQPYSNWPQATPACYMSSSQQGPMSGYIYPSKTLNTPAIPTHLLDNVVQKILSILPHETIENIQAALIQFSGNLEEVLNHLLNHQIQVASASHTQSQSHLPTIGQGASQLNSYSIPYDSSIVNHSTPPMWTSNLQPGASPDHLFTGDPSKIYSGQGRRKALLIGINYRGTASELRGCISDVIRMKALLVGLYGFLDIPEAIVTLRDDSQDWNFQPTRQNIIYAMQWLVAGAMPGDIFFVHYSGHGSQQCNYDGTETDGMDETILPCDFEQHGMIHDDEIHQLLAQPLPNGARLTAVFDCCHSGSGMDLPFIWNSHTFEWDEENHPIYTYGDVQMFSGCADAEYSADVQNKDQEEAGGAMTTAFISAVTANPWNHSYISLLDHIRKTLKTRGFKRQKPQLSSSQRFPIDRPFNLTDIVPNRNQIIGGQMKRQKTRRNFQETTNIGANGGSLLGMIGVVAGGLLMGELFD